MGWLHMPLPYFRVHQPRAARIIGALRFALCVCVAWCVVRWLVLVRGEIPLFPYIQARSRH